MRETFAHADGVIKESHYEERCKLWYRDRWKVFQPLVGRIRKFVDSSSIILDLGAGEGFFTKCCQENGLKSIALEGSMVAVNYGKNILGIDSRAHNLKGPLPFKSNSIDLIMFCDVYEHLPPHIDDNVFSESFRVLKPGGKFWVSTTCVYDTVECSMPEHINNPSNQELYRYGKKFGFTALILRPNFNISLLTPHYYERPTPGKKKLRQLAKKYHSIINKISFPFLIPIWYINSKFLHLSILDVLSDQSTILFTKPKQPHV